MPVYATLKRSIDFLVRVFFKDVEVSGLDNVPAEGGGIVVSWHPNGLIDPALILSQLPRRVVFGARDGLFKWPGLGWLMRALGTVPIYRSVDAGPGSSEAIVLYTAPQGVVPWLRVYSLAGNESLAIPLQDGTGTEQSVAVPTSSLCKGIYIFELRDRGVRTAVPVMIAK